MKTNRSLPGRLFLFIGLLLVSATFLINEITPLPDFFHGLLIGSGLGLEIMGFIQLRRNKTCDGPTTHAPIIKKNQNFL